MQGIKGKKYTSNLDDILEVEDDTFTKTDVTTTFKNAPMRPYGTNPILENTSFVFANDPEEQRSYLDELSEDSDDIISRTNTANTSHRERFNGWWCKHPKVRENWRLMLSAFSLLIVGIVLLLTGIMLIIYPIKGVQSIIFLIAGIICFIPGAYHVGYVYCAVKGMRGYSFRDLPLFN